MSFDDGVAARFARYRRQADATLEDIRLAEEAARKFSERLFDGLEYCIRYANDAGFQASTDREEASLRLRLSAGENADAEVVFARLPGAANETDEYLMHEELSRHTLPTSGYSGRVLGWVGVGERPVQTFAVYQDGTWRTKGMLVEKSRGKVDDPEEVLRGFCLRIIGRMVDICAPTDGVGRIWKTDEYGLSDYAGRTKPKTETRWLK